MSFLREGVSGRQIVVISLVVFAIAAIGGIAVWKPGRTPPPPERTPEQFLVPDQVIVTGSTNAITQVIDVLVAEEIIEKRPLAEHDLGAMMDNDWVMHLYQIIDDDWSEAEVLTEIESTARGLRLQGQVFADANYRVGLLGTSQCGEPYDSSGSGPYEPFGSPVGDSAEAGADLFWKQWAFEHIGAGSYIATTLTETSINPTGAGVNVAVFDTSPFEELPEGQVQTTKNMHPIPEIEIVYPDMSGLPRPKDTSKLLDVQDHGLFVVGLIHAVAPESNIKLYRVLDKYGCGDLLTLNAALADFLNTAGNAKSVINLSLGIHKPGAADDESTGDVAIHRKRNIHSLQMLMLDAYARDVVVVAAAGNDSYWDDKPLPQQFPAAYPFVIGVAASNIQRERARFSNWGDVFAPGGGGELVKDSDGFLGCSGSSGKSSLKPEDAVISLSKGSPTQYAYWRGTSFATPLVSGLAALVLERVPEKGGVSPDKVLEAIRCGAPSGDGVINIPATLFRCLP